MVVCTFFISKPKKIIFLLCVCVFAAAKFLQLGNVLQLCCTGIMKYEPDNDGPIALKCAVYKHVSLARDTSISNSVSQKYITST